MGRTVCDGCAASCNYSGVNVMRVLLTGGNGFLGRYVLAGLQRHGIETVMIGRTRPPHSAFARFIAADLLTSPNVASLVKGAAATHLLHLAWYVEHGRYWHSPMNLRWVEATTRLVEAFCQAGGQQLVMAGTCAEYDWSYAYCREDNTPLLPATLYGTAKDACRRLAMAVCAQHHVPCAWARMFMPFGTGESGQRLVPSLMDVFRGQREAFAIHANSFRDLLHAHDVAEGFLTLLRCGAKGAYNISSGQPVMLGDVAQQLAELLSADAQTVLSLDAARPNEPSLLVGENFKLKSLGWQATLSLAQGLERTVKET